MIPVNEFLKDQHIFYPDGFIAAPKISVILPINCKGNCTFLAGAIRSVLVQTFSEFELIVIDDGSTDSTMQTVLDMQHSDNRILFVRHNVHSGLTALRLNEGLMLARAPYIAYQSDEGQWTPDMLYVLYETMLLQLRPCLVYGKCKFLYEGKEQTIGHPFQYPSLVENNMIANHCVLHPKSFAFENGGYDCHIAMRLLYDWDLWLRWASRYLFVFVDQTLGQTSVNTPRPTRVSALAENAIFRIVSSLDKGSMLTPDRFQEYLIDDLSHLHQSFSSEFADLVYTHSLLPWFTQHSFILTSSEKAADVSKKKRTILVTKKHYNPSVDITVQNFTKTESKRLSAFYVPPGQINRFHIAVADVFVNLRNHYQETGVLQDKILEAGLPVIYMLDDDLLGLYKLGTEFDYLKPGTENYKQLVKHIRTADIVVTFSQVVEKAVRSLNPRVQLMKTNILDKYLNRTFPRRAPDSPFRIAYAGKDRDKEFTMLWPAFRRFSRSLGSRAEFYFMGLDPKQYGKLRSPVRYVPYNSSYYEYLDELTSRPFDVMIAPLIDEERCKKGKCPIKYLEITAAGSIGIYSNAVPFAEIKHGVTGIKTNNTKRDWLNALWNAYRMSERKRKKMWENARDHIREKFTTEVQSSRFESIIEAAKLHGMFRNKRYTDGLPRIAYFYGQFKWNKTAQDMLNNAIILNEYGFKVGWCFPTNLKAELQDEISKVKQHGFNVTMLPFEITRQEENTDQSGSMNRIRQWLLDHKIALLNSDSDSKMLKKAADLSKTPFVVGCCAADVHDAKDETALRLLSYYSQIAEINSGPNTDGGGHSDEASKEELLPLIANEGKKTRETRRKKRLLQQRRLRSREKRRERQKKQRERRKKRQERRQRRRLRRKERREQRKALKKKKERRAV